MIKIVSKVVGFIGLVLMPNIEPCHGAYHIASNRYQRHKYLTIRTYNSDTTLDRVHHAKTQRVVTAYLIADLELTFPGAQLIKVYYRDTDLEPNDRIPRFATNQIGLLEADVYF